LDIPRIVNNKNNTPQILINIYFTGVCVDELLTGVGIGIIVGVIICAGVGVDVDVSTLVIIHFDIASALLI
jgi:hypothetical protein